MMNRRPWGWVAWALWLSLSGGCGTVHRVEPILRTDRNSALPWRGSQSGLGALGQSVSFINPYTYNPDEVDFDNDQRLIRGKPSLHRIASDAADMDKARLARNRLQSAILAVSDETTAVHLSAIKSTDNVMNLIFGGATSALAGGATVASTEAAKGLAAAATGTNAFRSLFNEQVYRNALSESLIQAILADREKFHIEVIQVRQKEGIDTYPVEAAIRDASVYHERGSFYHGLSLIRKAVEKETKEKETATAAVQQQQIANHLSSEHVQTIHDLKALAEQYRTLPAGRTLAIGEDTYDSFVAFRNAWAEQAYGDNYTTLITGDTETLKQFIASLNAELATQLGEGE